MKGDMVKGKKVVFGLKFFLEINDEKFWFNVIVCGYFQFKGVCFVLKFELDLIKKDEYVVVLLWIFFIRGLL